MTTSTISPPPAPTAIQAVAAVMRDVEAVGKGQFNAGQKFKFRGIDDLMNAVAGPLRTHGVVIVPTVTERVSEVRGKMTAVWLTVTFRFYGPSGDYIEAVTMGEAADSFDKSTNKAMSAALKYALLQVLMIPVDGSFIEDADRHSPEGVRSPEPSTSEVDELFGAIKNVWNNPTGLRTVYGEAEGRGTLNLTGAGPDGQPITAGQLIQRRLRQLDVPQGDADEVAVARGEMLDAAKALGFEPARADMEFTKSYGHPISQATTAELRTMRDLLLEGAS